jgi:AbrB family looped-hinge helix DNA binding protein
MIASKVTKRGQTTLPRQIRNALQIQPGQSLVYEVREDEVILKAHPGVLASYGSLSSGKKTEIDLKNARKHAREEWTDHSSYEGVATFDRDFRKIDGVVVWPE